jgi:AcrR family transcriptional regulator
MIADESMPQSAKRPRQRAKRLATEAQIVDAFEELITTVGVAGLGVNALVKRAGVGKKQVYDYFGGLSGVAETWVRERGVWPSLERILDEPLDAFSLRPPGEKLRIINERYANWLRSSPRLAELLSGEFVKNNEVKDAIDHIRQLVRADFERVLSMDKRLTEPDFLALNTMAYAASTYLGLRAHHQPRFFGFDLSAETSWQMVMHMFQRVMDMADPSQRPLREPHDKS